MTSVLHSILPLRRRARSTDTLNPRFGDVSISAPNEGSWYSRISQPQVIESLDPNIYQSPAPTQPSVIHNPQIVEESNGLGNQGEDSVAFRNPVRRDHRSVARGRSTVPKFGSQNGNSPGVGVSRFGSQNANSPGLGVSKFGSQNAKSPGLGEVNNPSLPPSTWTRKQYALDYKFTSPSLGSMLSPVDETFAKQGPSQQALAVPSMSIEELTNLVDQAAQSVNSRPSQVRKQATGLFEGTMTSQGAESQMAQLNETYQEIHSRRDELSKHSDGSEAVHDLTTNSSDHPWHVGVSLARPRAPSADGYHRRNSDRSQPSDRHWARSTSANPIIRRPMSNDESLDQFFDMPPLSAASGTSCESSMKSDYSPKYAPSRPQSGPHHQTDSLCSNTVVVDSPRSLNSVIWQPIPAATRHDSVISTTSNESYSNRSPRYREQFAKPSNNLDMRTGRSQDDMSQIASSTNEQETRSWRSPSPSCSTRRAASETRRPRPLYDDIENDYAQLKQEFMAKPISPGIGLSMPRLKKKMRSKRAESTNSKEGPTPGKLSPLLARNFSGTKDSPRFGLPSPDPSLRSWATTESESRGPTLVPSYEELWC